MTIPRSSRPSAVSVAIALAFASAVAGGSATPVHAAALGGPVIIGGDDLSRFGSRVGGVNLGGWKYIETAIAEISADVSAPGPFTVDIAALGPFALPNCPGSCPDGDGDPALGIGSVAEDLGLSVEFYGDAAQIDGFFDALRSLTVRPRIIWLAGCNLNKNALCTPDISAESEVLLENATTLSGFVAAGHGLMAHGAKGNTNPLKWLTALLPNVNITYRDCEADGITLTSEGMSVLPGLVDSDIDDTVAECNNQFTIPAAGGFGGLRILALEGAGVAPDLAVCVGGSDEGLACPSLSACPGGSCQSGAAFILGGDAGTLVSGCGDDDVNVPGEECDGTDDSACPEDCLPPGDALECRCNRCDVPLAGCKLPTEAQKAKLSINDNPDDTKDKLSWKWLKGAVTTKAEFEDGSGNTPIEDGGPVYQLCVFGNTNVTPTLIARAAVRSDTPLPTSCNLFSSNKPCWKEIAPGFKYKNKESSSLGVNKLDLKAGAAGKAKVGVKVKGRAAELPEGTYPLAGPIKVQLSNGETCWEANYSTFKKNEEVNGKKKLKAAAD